MRKIALISCTALLLAVISVSRVQAVSTDPAAFWVATIYHSNTGHITYTMNWNVATSTPVTNLTLHVPIPAGTTLVSSQGNGTTTGGSLVWNIGDQPAGSSGSVTAVVAVDAATVLNPWASSVQWVSQGQDSGGVAVPVENSNSLSMLGSEDGSKFSLGVGGSAVLAFSVPLVAGPGFDIHIASPSTPGGVEASVSNNGFDWSNVTLSGNDIDIGNNLATYTFLRLTDVSASGEGFQVDAVKSIHLFPFSCAITTHPTLTGTQDGSSFTIAAMSRVDIVQGCGSGSGSGTGSGSGFSGTGLFNGFYPGEVVNDYHTASASPPHANDDTGNTGGGNGGQPGGGHGGGVSSEGGFIPNVPSGRVLGTSTISTSEGLSYSTPEDQGGSGEELAGPRILGVSTSLPRTGVALGMIVVFIVLSIMPFRHHHRKKPQHA